MRKLVAFTLGFAAGCALGAYLLSGTLLLLLAGLVFTIALVASTFAKRKTALVFAGITIGALWLLGYQSLFLSGASAYDTKTVHLRVTASDYSEKSKYGFAVDGKVSLNGKTYPIRIYYYEELPMSPGDVLEGRFRLSYTARGGSGESYYQQSKGIFLLGYAVGEVTHTGMESKALTYFPVRLRRSVLQRIGRIFPSNAVGFARALLLGDTEKLTYAEDSYFKLSGIRHVVAVSGLHISVLFSLIYLLMGKRRMLTALFGIPLLFLFAAVAGFTPSITRACIMQVLMILAMLCKREYDMPSALAFACLCILAQNPLSIASVGFQLSAGCMVGILLFSSRIQRRFAARCAGKHLKARVLSFAISSFSVSVGTMIVTAPLCILYFGCISIISVLTNFLTLWLISAIFYGILAACLLSFLYFPAGKLLGAVLSYPISYVLTVAKGLGSLPFAAVFTSSVYILLWVIFAYGLILFFCLRARQNLKAMTLSIAGTLMVSLLLTWAEPRTDNYRVTVLDVGQGQCVLLQSRGENYIVDCGGSSDKTAATTAADWLFAQGISQIDGVIITHYDEDHIGGLAYFLQRVRADTLYFPVASESVDLTDYAGENMVFVRGIMKFSCGMGEITLIPGDPSFGKNESSTCILYQVGECDILITGDRDTAGEELLMKQIELPKLEYLIAGHHGSDASTSLSLLAHTRPEMVLISVGDNHYGHPNEETLLRLRMFGCKVYRTDYHGTITIRG